MWATLLDVETAVVGVLGAVGVLLAAIAGAYALYTKSRNDSLKAKAEAKKSEIDGWRSLVAAHEEQGDRRERIMQGQQVVLELEQRSHVRCQRGYEQLRSALYFVRDHLNRLHDQVVELGGKPGEKLELPTIMDLETDTAERTDFLSRQLQQNQEAVKDADKDIAQQKAILTGQGSNSDVGPNR